MPSVELPFTPNAPLAVVRAGAPEERSDSALCRAFLDGDEAAFGELIRRHQPLVQRLVRRYAASAGWGHGEMSGED